MCGSEYTDHENRLSILMHTICISCIIENEKQLEAWEAEGGFPNDSC